MEQSPKVQNKITKILEILEYIECIPTKYLKHMESTDGLYEMRITLGSAVVCPTMLPDTCRNESSLYDDGFPPEIPVPTHPAFLSDRVPRCLPAGKRYLL